MELLHLQEEIYESAHKFVVYLQNYTLTTENSADVLQKFSLFITDIMDKSKDYCDKLSVPKHENFSVTSYLLRYYAVYDFFKSALMLCKSDEKVLIEVNRYVCEEFINLSQNIGDMFEGSDTVGSFINLVDMCLEKIEEIHISQGVSSANSALQSSKLITEEILLFAMSIAQVGYNDDKKIITAGCRTVLNNLNDVNVEINKSTPNLAMCNLVVETYTNAVCALEAKVNIAVLNLCLKVFSSYQQIIEDLYKACLNINSVSEELQVLISNFDLHMDRIFQIGVFSLACSSINKRSADVKMLVSNLQFLEKELIPSFKALYVNSSPERIKYASIYKKFWCKQVKKLRCTVHNIIEPEAYCKIVYEELKQSTEKLWEHITTGMIVEKAMIDPFLIYSTELGKMIKSSLYSLNELKDAASIKLQLVYNVLQELIAARNRLLEETSSFTTEEINHKVFKRCKILVTAIKDLWFCLRGDIPETLNEDSFAASTEIDSSESNETGTILDSIIDKSRQLIKDRVVHATITINPTSKTYSKKDYNRAHCLGKRDIFMENNEDCTMESVLGDLTKFFKEV